MGQVPIEEEVALSLSSTAFCHLFAIVLSSSYYLFSKYNLGVCFRRPYGARVAG